jgi:hypothetical protein
LGFEVPDPEFVLSFALIGNPAVDLRRLSSMWRRTLFVCIAVIATTAFAQEGHPLSGTWTGDWGPSAAQRTHITLVMNWEGDKITGVINPGPDSAPLNVFVDYANWAVRIDAEAKDAAGKAVRIEAEGKLEEMGSARRKLLGTWRQGAQTGDFKVTRQP